jgi:hypothetical protein
MQEAKAAEITGSQSMDLKTLHILIKTDRGYYSPGDIIRVKGTITGVTGTAVQAQVLFSFQGMNQPRIPHLMDTHRTDPHLAQRTGEFVQALCLRQRRGI